MLCRIADRVCVSEPIRGSLGLSEVSTPRRSYISISKYHFKYVTNSLMTYLGTKALVDLTVYGQPLWAAALVGSYRFGAMLLRVGEQMADERLCRVIK